MIVHLLACALTPDPRFLLEPGTLRAGGERASTNDQDDVLDIALAAGPHKARVFDALSVDPEVSVAELDRVLGWLLYAGSREPIRVDGGRLLANLPLPETCDLPIVLVDRTRVMHLRRGQVPLGQLEVKSVEALTHGAEVRCGQPAPQPGDCTRGMIVATPMTRWVELAPHVHGDWTLLTMDLGAAGCMEATNP